MKQKPILFSTPMVKAILSGDKTMTRRDASRSDYSFKKAPGGLLWVREEHYRYGYWVKDGFTLKGNQKWKFVAATNEVRYSDNSPYAFRISRDKQYPEKPFWYKRNSLFMPKSACRIMLETTNVRLQTLQSISESDAKKEGVTIFGPDLFKNYLNENIYVNTAYDSFKSLWSKINGEDSWNANPWVWVIEFKRVEP